MLRTMADAFQDAYHLGDVGHFHNSGLQARISSMPPHASHRPLCLFHPACCASAHCPLLSAITPCASPPCATMPAQLAH